MTIISNPPPQQTPAIAASVKRAGSLLAAAGATAGLVLGVELGVELGVTEAATTLACDKTPTPMEDALTPAAVAAADTNGENTVLKMPPVTATSVPDVLSRGLRRESNAATCALERALEVVTVAPAA